MWIPFSLKPIIRKCALKQIEENTYFETPNRLTSCKCFYTIKTLFLNHSEHWITSRGHLQYVKIRYFVFVAFKLKIFYLKVTNSLPLNIINFGIDTTWCSANSAVTAYILSCISCLFSNKVYLYIIQPIATKRLPCTSDLVHICGDRQCCN